MAIAHLAYSMSAPSLTIGVTRTHTRIAIYSNHSRLPITLLLFLFVGVLSSHPGT